MNPVIKSCANVLIHVPDLVRYGSKPSREIEKNQELRQEQERKRLPQDPDLRLKIEESLRKYEEALAYPPNQVFIGNLEPGSLKEIAWPWFKNLLPSASNLGKFGEIMPEEEFYGLLKMCDISAHDLVWLEKSFAAKVKEKLANHPLFDETDIQKIGEGKTIEEIEEKIKMGKWFSVPLFCKGQLIGCFNRSKDIHAKEDEALGPHPLMEGLVAKASGALALKHLLGRLKMAPEEIDYILSCSEEAVGDRYNRGGGSLAKVIGEICHCQNATGPDIKAFCVGPIYAAIIAGSLIKAGIAKNVAVVGGGCLAKLGMKFQGHLESKMPILEDALASIAFLVVADDGKSPVINLDATGKNSIKTAGKQEDVMRAVILEPLKKLGMKITDIDKYAVQLENPDITIPAKAGDIAKNYYNMIAALAVLNKEITPKDIGEFREKHGMIGFAPTQGHIPAAVAYLGHALEAINSGKIKNALFVARGSLFLGRMSELYDGVSFIIEKNPKQGRWCKLWEYLKTKKL